MAKESIRPSNKEFEKLGKAIRRVLRADYFYAFDNWKRFLFMSFARGIMIGLGGVIGATLVLGLLVWLLSVLQGIPFIGDLFEETREQLRP